MALTVGISHRERPHPLGAVRAAYKDLLDVEHIFVALAKGPHFDTARIATRAPFREELPHPRGAAVDRPEKRLFLLVGTPPRDRGGAHRRTAVVERRQRKAGSIGFLFEDDCVVDVEPAATILLGPSRKEPTLGAQFSAQLTPDLIIFVGFGGGSRFTSNSGWHIGLKPGPHFSPKSLLFVVI